jgi:hypothetical protein
MSAFIPSCLAKSSGGIATMNKELKEKWVDALRSGKYTQGRMYLRNDKNEFCCLGVLCDAYNSKGWVQRTGTFPRYGEGVCYIPEEIAYAIGIENEQQNKLSVKNDNEKAFFHEIADYIERNF